MNGYWDEIESRNYDALENDLERASRLWDVVYSRMEMAFADIDASRPTLDELEEGTAKDDGPDEVAILREATYEVVQAALIYLRP